MEELDRVVSELIARRSGINRLFCRLLSVRGDQA